MQTMADDILGEEIRLRDEGEERRNKEDEERRMEEEEGIKKNELKEKLRKEKGKLKSRKGGETRKGDELRETLEAEEKRKRGREAKKSREKGEAGREREMQQKQREKEERKKGDEEKKEEEGERKEEKERQEMKKKKEEEEKRLRNEQEEERDDEEKNETRAERARKKGEEEFARKKEKREKADIKYMKKWEEDLKKKEEELRRREEELKKREEEEKRRTTAESRKQEEEKMQKEQENRRKKGKAEPELRLKREEKDEKKVKDLIRRQSNEEKRTGEEKINEEGKMAYEEARKNDDADLRKRKHELEKREKELGKREEEEKQRQDVGERKKQRENNEQQNDTSKTNDEVDSKEKEERLKGTVSGEEKRKEIEGARRNEEGNRRKKGEENMVREEDSPRRRRKEERRDTDEYGKWLGGEERRRQQEEDRNSEAEEAGKQQGSVVGYSSVRILSSGLSEPMQRTALECAIQAVNKFGSDHMHMAQHIMMQFEHKYGTAWHCVVAEEDLGFFIRYEAHIHFCVSTIIICLFMVSDMDRSAHKSIRVVNPDPYIMNQMIPPDLRVIKSGMRHDQNQYAIGLTVSAIERFNDDRMAMTHNIVIGFEHVYGAPFHCVASRSRSLGFYVRYDPENVIYFRLAGFTVFIFRQQTRAGKIASPLPQAAEPMEERTTQSVEYPGDARIIATGMTKDAQDFSIATAQEGLEQSFENEKMRMAQYLRNAFEERYGAPFHCIVSDGHLGFYGHYDPERYIYFAVKNLTVLLFRHLEDSAPPVRTEEYVPPEEKPEDVRIAASGMTPQMTQCAVQLAKEGLEKYPDEKMHIAQHVVTGFEEWFGVPYHCILSDGQLGFNVGYDANNHAYFGVGPITVFLFRNN
ncbi:hypothetical protein Tcan_12328 [Toxocara canis]|uniref:Dynein light chain type 1 n=1 Tax=Toxocara canis TaxID=6265 RepID=A0A0B2VSD2_TOXCA|nr:hypothetical protein Tcan_12328 [Toxocara canis]